MLALTPQVYRPFQWHLPRLGLKVIPLLTPLDMISTHISDRKGILTDGGWKTLQLLISGGFSELGLGYKVQK